MTAALHRAAAVVGAALVSPPREVGVSWFAGAHASRPERVEAYDLATLADDVRALVQLVRPKGDGAALCPAVFGDLDGDAPDLDAPRRIAHLRRASLVQLDVDAGATMREVVAMLGAWGVAAVVWPSPSATGEGLDAERCRALVQLAPDLPRVEGRARRTHPASVAGRRALVQLARRELGGARVDEGPAAATALAYVHPRHAPRPASDVALLRGRAVDLVQLAAAAVVAGVIAPFDASVDRHRDGAPYDLATLVDLAAAAGLALHQGGRVTAVECPRADEHSDGKGRGGRGDTSCAIGPWRDPWRCEHSHGGAGRLGARAMVQLALQRVRNSATRERLDAALHAAEGPVARVRERLAAEGAEVSRIFADDVPDLMREVGRYLRAEHARAGRAAVVLRASPGAGKSRGVAALVDAAAPPPASDEREAGDKGPPEAPRPVAVILTDQRARIPDLAGAIFNPVSGPRRLPLVHTPVSRVLGADGAAVCVHERATGAASRIERAGGSARTVLCIKGRCPYTKECPAHDPLTPHDGARPRPDLSRRELPNVVVATHATDVIPRHGGLVVVDEAHASPWEALEVNDRDPEALTHAATLAGWQENEGVARITAAVCRALAATPQSLRDLDAPARLTWCADRAMELPPRALRRVHEALEAEGAPSDPRARVADALAGWASRDDAFALAHERRANHRVLSWRDGTVRVADDAGAALRAVRAWVAGAPVVPVLARREGRAAGVEAPEAEGTRITWETAATRLAARWFAAGGVVAHLDATGDAELARAMFGEGASKASAALYSAELRAADEAVAAAVGALRDARAAESPVARRRRARRELRATLAPPSIPGAATVALDALTRDVARARRRREVVAAFGAAPIGAPHVVDARLPDRREVTRVVVADTRGTSRSQLSPRRGAVAPSVRWDRIGSQLGAVLARLQLWRELRPGVEVVGAGLARQIIARTLAAFWQCTDAAADTSAAVDAACTDLRPDASITRADVARELAALLSDARALARVADLRAAAPSWRWTYPGSQLARGSNDLRAATVMVALGDFRATPAEASAVAARTGREASAEASRLAGAVSVQWFGRARVVRDGPPVLFVHVGELPPPDWRGDEGVEVVAAGARAVEVVDGAPVEAPANTSPSPAAAADTPAARAVGALLAAGWTPGELARRLAVTGRDPASVARTLRRWRAGGEAGDAALLAAVVDLAREARDPADALRARVVYLTRGRGNARVWSGAGGAPGLRVFADRFGVDVSLADLAAFAGGASRPAVVDLLLRDVMPGSPVVAVLEAAHGIAPPPPLDGRSSAGERARVVAEGSVEGSEWTRPDALRLRPGVARPPHAPPPAAPLVQLAPPAAATPATPATARRRRTKGAPAP